MTLLIEIGQAGVYRRGRIGGVQLIMPVRIEARRIEERAKLQGATPPRTSRGHRPAGAEAPQGGAHKRRAGCGEERSAAERGRLRMPVHGYPPKSTKVVSHRLPRTREEPRQEGRRSRTRRCRRRRVVTSEGV